MIYTHGLDQSTDHIMVYDNNTSIAIIKLVFVYAPNESGIFSNCTTVEEWIEDVQKVLDQYAAKYHIEPTKLSAKPIRITHQWELTNA